MNAIKVLGVIFLAVVVALFIVGGCAVAGYNRAISLDEQAKSAWAQVDNQLQRRFELIPSLVETVKGVAAQEQEVFLGIAESREAYFAAKDVNEQVQASNRFESALSRLLVLQERYPELKSNESFMKLMDSLEGANNRIAVERKRYNDAVEVLNGYTRKFPGRVYSSLAGVTAREYFEAEPGATKAPEVDFSKEKDEG